MTQAVEGGGTAAALMSLLSLSPRVSEEQMLENVRSCLGRNLREAGQFRAHDRKLCVAGGGPSLADTWRDLDGVTAACNGSLSFLLERGVTPWACGVLDPGAHMAEIIEPHRDVFYFVASVCHPDLFDRLKDCTVIVWHPSGLPGLEEVLTAGRGDRWMTVGGPSTIGLRWFNLGYVMGFRDFEGHGLDSSYRDGERYAYEHQGPHYQPVNVDGFRTSPNMMGQVADFLALIERWSQPDIDPVRIEIRGDGLLPTYWRRYKDRFPGKLARLHKK